MAGHGVGLGFERSFGELASLTREDQGERRQSHWAGLLGVRLGFG